MGTVQLIKSIFGTKEMKREKSLKALLKKLEEKKEKLKFYLDTKLDKKDIIDKKEELELILLHIKKGKKLLEAM